MVLLAQTDASGYQGLASCLLCLNDLRNWIQKKGNADVLDFIVQDERAVRVVVMPSCLSGMRIVCWGSIRLTIQVTLTTQRHRCSYTNYTPSALVELNVNWHIANLIFCLGLHLHSIWSFLISLAVYYPHCHNNVKRCPINSNAICQCYLLLRWFGISCQN